MSASSSSQVDLRSGRFKLERIGNVQADTWDRCKHTGMIKVEDAEDDAGLADLWESKGQFYSPRKKGNVHIALGQPTEEYNSILVTVTDCEKKSKTNGRTKSFWLKPDRYDLLFGWQYTASIDPQHGLKLSITRDANKKTADAKTIDLVASAYDSRDVDTEYQDELRQRAKEAAEKAELELAVASSMPWRRTTNDYALDTRYLIPGGEGLSFPPASSAATFISSDGKTVIQIDAEAHRVAGWETPSEGGEELLSGSTANDDLLFPTTER